MRIISKLAIVVALGGLALLVSCTGGESPQLDGGPGEDLDAASDRDGGVTTVCDPGARTGGVWTLAGCDTAGAIDGTRGAASFANPVNVIRGPDGAVYVADFDNDRIRTIDDEGRVDTLVEQPGFGRPFGLAFAADGTLYVSTDMNPDGVKGPMTGTIWAIDRASGRATPVVRDIGRPRGLVALDDGRIVLSDYQHHTIRILTPATKSLVALAGTFDQPGAIDGTGAAARFSVPVGMARLADGRIAIADMMNHRVRAVALDGTVTTLAGTGAVGDLDGPAAGATFARPAALAIDDAGTLYIADADNFVVRRIAAGVVSTLVGNGNPGSRDSDRLLDAEVFGLEGLAVAADASRLWIADGSRGEDAPHHRVRVAELAP